MKSNGIAKINLTLAAISLLFFGWIGFIASVASCGNNVSVEKYYIQHHLNDKNGIAVDSAGNIYIGEAETGSIQIYDRLGHFQYGFSFPTGAGWFAFGIDRDKIHIVTARTDSYFVIDKGKLVYSQKGIDYNRSEELQTMYHMNERRTFTKSNKVYKILLFNTVSIYDRLTRRIEYIHLNAPIWPFPIIIFWMIMVCGMISLFVLHYKFFLSIFQKRLP